MPDVRDAQWARTSIDRFILARLDREGVLPSAEADKPTLLRRVTLDLIGLPPTSDEVDEFLSDAQPGAYERVVDRLLASPHFGERWARPWLDLCHYGDSDGYLTDQLRPVAWRYRDWLVGALNDNLPFDQFTLQQLAGDLLPDATIEQRIATGYLRQTLSNREGGADLEEFRVHQVIDRTSMVGTAWLGLTVGCAQCHDHKYDPLTQTEFYQLYAYFNNADEVNVDAPLPAERDLCARTQPEYERRRSQLIAPLATELAEIQRRWEEKLLYAAAHPGEDHTWDRQWEVLGLIWGGHLGEGQLEGTEIVRLKIELRTTRQQADLLDYFLRNGSVIDPAQFDKLKLGELQKQLAALRKEFPASTRAPVMQSALNPRPTHLHERGEFRNRGVQVQPGTPRWLPPLEKCDDPPRLAFARWLVSNNNPLTGRVTVNRIWQEHFGRGLVLTSEDFGLRGERPSHPELLDWLAAEFVSSGWDVKALHRLIVTSAVYRQSSRPRPDLDTRDPSHLWLARQSSLRLPAETIRDASLAVSGLYCSKLGGPAVKPPQPDRVVMEAFGYNDWKVSTGEDRYRRGLYTFLLRTSPFAQAIIFDAPNTSLVCSRRVRSNTPLQALTLLNDAAFMEMAKGLAQWAVTQSAANDVERLRLAFVRCLGRMPTDAEQARLIAYLESQHQACRNDRESAKHLSSESGGEVGHSELAAWTSLASVLLNLHEFITRD